MQFIDPELLKHRLLESLWYYHANPPLLNLLAGIGLKLFGEHSGMFFSAVFHLLGLLVATSVYALTLRLSSARPAAIIATALLLFSPSFVLYENWLMYSFPAAALLTMSAWALHRYLETERTRWCVAFFSILAALLLMRSLFHLAWMVLIVILLAASLWGRRRQVLLAAVLPVLVVALWYGKNYYYFGVFSGSTWMGLGLSNISTLVATREELQPLVDDGRLTPFAMVSRYEEMERLFTSQQLPPTGIPVLDDVTKSNGIYNFNNQQLIAINSYYTHDGLTVIRTYPFSYVVGLIISNRLFFSPSNTNAYFSAGNRAAVKPMEQVFNPLLYGVGTMSNRLEQPHFGFTKESFLEVNTSVPLMVLWVLVLGYGYVQARQGLMSSDPARRSRAVMIGFILISALYLYAVGTAVELGENYRYRFNIEPLFFVLTATAATGLLRVVRQKVGKRPSAPSVSALVDK
ncbi:MAG: glycosyltransferase family 39 protein [Pseudomonadota bacterium]|nr:glycosyltransferase family 39 protein [Pseudomonadota bacterium]